MSIIPIDIIANHVVVADCLGFSDIYHLCTMNKNMMQATRHIIQHNSGILLTAFHRECPDLARHCKDAIVSSALKSSDLDLIMVVKLYHDVNNVYLHRSRVAKTICRELDDIIVTTNVLGNFDHIKDLKNEINTMKFLFGLHDWVDKKVSVGKKKNRAYSLAWRSTPACLVFEYIRRWIVKQHYAVVHDRGFKRKLIIRARSFKNQLSCIANTDVYPVIHRLYNLSVFIIDNVQSTP